MVRPQAIILGLVVVHLLLVPCVWFVKLTHPSDDYNRVIFMLVPTQGALLGFWIALGRRRAMPWRACLGVAATAGAVLWYYRFCREPDPLYLPLLMMQMYSVAVALLAMRLTGLRLTCLSDSVAPSGWMQFSLSEIIGWTATTALTLGSIRYLAQEASALSVLFTDRFAICVVALFTVLTFAPIWAVFGARWVISRFLGWVIVVGLGSVVLENMLGRQDLYWWFAFLLTSYTVLLTASLLVIRLAGYRLQWQWRLGKRKFGMKPNEPLPDPKHA